MVAVNQGAGKGALTVGWIVLKNGGIVKESADVLF